jgi:phage/plasmid-associated DNA primase
VATDAYRDSQDVFAEFIDDRCRVGEGLSVTAASLRGAYDEWCEDNGIKFPLGVQAFAEKLEAKGCIKHKGAKGARLWFGIALKPAGGDGGDGGEGVDINFYKDSLANNTKPSATRATYATQEDLF